MVLKVLEVCVCVHLFLHVCIWVCYILTFMACQVIIFIYILNHMYCLIWGLPVLHHSNPFVMALWYWTLVHVEMLIWAVHLLCKKHYLISYCILIKDAYCMISKIGLNSLKIMDSNHKNFKSIAMYCILIPILTHFLLLCRTWNTAPWRSCPSVWRTWGSVWTRRSPFSAVSGQAPSPKRASSPSSCLR